MASYCNGAKPRTGCARGSSPFGPPFGCRSVPGLPSSSRIPADLVHRFHGLSRQRCAKIRSCGGFSAPAKSVYGSCVLTQTFLPERLLGQRVVSRWPVLFRPDSFSMASGCKFEDTLSESSSPSSWAFFPKLRPSFGAAFFLPQIIFLLQRRRQAYMNRHVSWCWHRLLRSERNETKPTPTVSRDTKYAAWCRRTVTSLSQVRVLYLSRRISSVGRARTHRLRHVSRGTSEFEFGRGVEDRLLRL